MKRKSKATDVNDGQIVGYDYSTEEKRIETAMSLFAKASTARAAVEMEWEKWNDYYNFIHDATAEVKEWCNENGIPWTPAVVPDCFIQVESQIQPTVPAPEFRGRDDDRDSKKAKERELAVQYVIENNRLEDMNNSNERRLVKLGDAFWKVYWDPTMRCGPSEGDIRVVDVPVEAIYVDPSCKNNGIQSGQYVGYVYAVHRVQFAQIYRKRLEELGVTVDEIATGEYMERNDMFDLTLASDITTDTIQVLEWWYKVPQTYYDKQLKMEVPAGAVACSIQAGGKEMKHIPLYWHDTYRQNSLFPFVHYWRLRDENSFYNKSELYAIKDLVDAADRKFSATLLNDCFTANDIVVMEEGTMPAGVEFVNAPGAVNIVKQNKSGTVTRLGGLHTSSDNSFANFIMEQIQRANRNYDTNLGRETTRQTTATGLAMLREDSNEQGEVKGHDREKGFERLFELIDWHCLEFFDDQRLLFIGAKNEFEEPQEVIYSRDRFAKDMPAVYDPETREVLRESWKYWPRIDVTVNVDNGVAKGKQATLAALDKIAAMGVNAENWKLVLAMVDILGIPQKKQLEEEWKNRFEPIISPQIQQALAQDPQLMAALEQMVMMKGGAGNAVSAMPYGNAPVAPTA